VTPAVSGTGRRRRGRELALRVLFELEGTSKDPEFALRYQGEDLRATADVRAFARTIVLGCVDHLDAIDTALAAAMEHWSLVDLARSSARCCVSAPSNCCTWRRHRSPW